RCCVRRCQAQQRECESRRHIGSQEIIKMKLMRIITIAIIAASIGGGIYIAKPQSLRPHPKEVHLRNIRQLTFGGDNAEAYWSLDGQKIIFQSTRDQIKCDQIFTMNRDGSNLKMVSTGKGRTSCGYFTPDGKQIVFTSARDGDLEIYDMNIDGTQQRRLTHDLGYDGGAWHSQDGQWIVWRASRPKTPQEVARYKELFAKHLVMPIKLELMVMRADGSDQRQITNNGAANFAPYFHPNGRQIIFASN